LWSSVEQAQLQVESGLEVCPSPRRWSYAMQTQVRVKLSEVETGLEVCPSPCKWSYAMKTQVRVKLYEVESGLEVCLSPCRWQLCLVSATHVLSTCNNTLCMCLSDGSIYRNCSDMYRLADIFVKGTIL